MKKHPQFHAESSLLKLLDQRHKSLGLGSDKPYNKPHLDSVTIHLAAEAHAKVNVSDPFARARITLHMRQGYELPSDVLADAHNKERARSNAKSLLDLAA